ncbi:ABC-type transport system, involved in lipoprotein release, permease component [Candidatus Methanoperedens nitroreducens]|uniref:ABC-type transport system, involved in lipoprotein release, permease component n=1 Tax=Candidatus Methanoperedens nitratireducens TaxID=1392998 RepID=A0A062V661_9EURY|nr:ABC transporter permease [Candidatus Methanoperedens nitroreducens]KCZ72802.1 ABC-type transport system, involved in lipoprotein release, permease component [Candidatus Methanoperedens nitroreducens]MDJ1423268.1 ABC transporter permease [Candidatus Methanoperedens sp.]
MIALRGLAHNKFRTILSAAGIAIAVISIMLLGSTGSGLIRIGEKTLERSSMDMWLTGKTFDLKSQFAGGSEGKITDAHKLESRLLKNSNIDFAMPVLTEIVYAYKEGAEPKAVFGTGLEGTGGSFVSILQGEGLIGDSHYNSGLYNGPWKREILIDGRAAKLLDVTIGDTLHIGKTLTEARKQEFKVIGLTNSLSSFTTGPMIVLYLSELQEITGNHYYDSVNLVMLRLKDPSRAEETQKQLETQYPEYAVSTNLNLIKKIIRQNSPVLAGAFFIVVLAVLMGVLLAVNTVLLSLNERKNEAGILKVMGLSKWSIIRYLCFDGFLVCIAGGITGVLLSLPLSRVLNILIYRAVGFEDLVLIDNSFIYIGTAAAVITGLVTSLLAAMWINRINAAELLRSV